MLVLTVWPKATGARLLSTLLFDAVDDVVVVFVGFVFIIWNESIIFCIAGTSFGNWPLGAPKVMMYSLPFFIVTIWINLRSIWSCLAVYSILCAGFPARVVEVISVW